MTMTTQSILVLAGIVSVFATFGIVLAWADFYTQRRPTAVGDEPLSARRDHQELRDERRAA